jgi:alkaline phosphatase
MRKLIFLFMLSSLMLASACSNQTTAPKAKYVFLFIGDGMGTNQVYSTQLFKAALAGNTEPAELSFTTFPVQSHMSTFSANSLVTCSAASGTALASGHKTNNGVLGKDTSLTISYESIAEKLKKAGYKVGILSSVGINHATPGSFYAHQDHRGMYYEIAKELPLSGFDYFGGGGFINPTDRDKSKTDAYQLATEAGYTLANTAEAIDALKAGNEKVFAVNPGIYPGGDFYWRIDNKEESLSLAHFVKKGIELLTNPQGFFMMVEGGKIDWACHSNDAAASIHETIDFDKAVAEALAFYQQYPDETLIIVTADHETGGMIVGNGHKVDVGLLQYQNISAQEFGRTLVHFKENNPKASFDEVMALVQSHFGLGDADKGLELNPEEVKQFKAVYAELFKGDKGLNPDKDYLASNETLTLPDLALQVLSRKAGISWASNDHSGTPVPVFVLGQGQNYFSSRIDNTDIPKIVGKVMNVE